MTDNKISIDKYISTNYDNILLLYENCMNKNNYQTT